MNTNEDDRFFMLVTFGLAFAAWIRTTEAMYFVSPQNYMTFSGVELKWLYAAFNAAWIEFTILYIIRRFGKVNSSGAWLTLMLIMVGLFAVSFAAQGIDAAIVTERIENLPPYLQLTLYYVLPSIATILLFVLGLAHAVTATRTQPSATPKQPNQTMAKAAAMTQAMYDAAMRKLTQTQKMPVVMATSGKGKKPVVSTAPVVSTDAEPVTQMQLAAHDAPKEQPPEPGAE